MARGTVKWLNGDKGYGFIAVEGGPDVFVSFSAITGGGYRTWRKGRRSSSISRRARRDYQVIVPGHRRLRQCRLMNSPGPAWVFCPAGGCVCPVRR